MEVFGGSGGRKQYVSQAQLQKLADGGRKADGIHELSEQHHKNFELSQAEKLIEEANEEYEKQKREEEREINRKEKEYLKPSLFQKITDFFKRIFYPLEK